MTQEQILDADKSAMVFLSEALLAAMAKGQGVGSWNPEDVEMDDMFFGALNESHTESRLVESWSVTRTRRLAATVRPGSHDVRCQGAPRAQEG